MSWINSTLDFAGIPNGASLDVLLKRDPQVRTFFKGKSDYVQEPIPKKALEKIWKRLYEMDAKMAELQFTILGGKIMRFQNLAFHFHTGLEIYSKFIMHCSGMKRASRRSIGT